jgi:soluble lytic murein transglycosylase-like protein
MRRNLLAGLVVLALAAGACSSGEEPEVAAGTAQGSSTTVTEPVTSSTVATTTTSTPPPATTKATPVIKAPPPPVPATHGPESAPFATTVISPAPTAPAELARMADELAAAEARLHDPATPAADIPSVARRQQAIYRAIAARPEALAAVIERIPEALRPSVDANVAAGVELRRLAGSPRTQLPPWRIIPPPPATELEAHYKESETRYGVPWEYLAAVHLVESRMGRIRGTSSAGAQGPMQFLPATWAAYGEGGDINDPRDAILAAGRYLHRNGAPGDMAKALWNYNHSDRYVRAVTLYAQQMEADPRAYLAYHAWQVYYIMTRGDVLLEEGYGG